MSHLGKTSNGNNNSYVNGSWRENNAELKGKCENRVLNVLMSEAEPIQG